MLVLDIRSLPATEGIASIHISRDKSGFEINTCNGPLISQWNHEIQQLKRDWVRGG
jgi:hypothetical protein